MANPILNLSDSSLWTQVINTTLYAVVSPVNQNFYTPIPDYVPGVYLDHFTLAIGASSTQTKPNWKLGFWLIPRFTIAGIGTADVGYHSIALGLNLVRIPPMALPYTLRIRVPKWHREMSFTIWTYSGTENEP